MRPVRRAALPLRLSSCRRGIFLGGGHPAGNAATAADAIRSSRGDAPVFGWLCAIARRKAADELRRRGRMADPPGDDNESSGLWVRMEREELPEDCLEQAEERANVVRAWALILPAANLLLGPFAAFVVIRNL